MAEIVATVGREALKPLSPVHVTARREAGGIRIRWMRRTRVGGDGWDAADVPLGEEAERYEVEILGNGAVMRSLAVSDPAVFYAAAQEMADFGAP